MLRRVGVLCVWIKRACCCCDTRCTTQLTCPHCPLLWRWHITVTPKTFFTCKVKKEVMSELRAGTGFRLAGVDNISVAALRSPQTVKTLQTHYDTVMPSTAESYAWNIMKYVQSIDGLSKTAKGRYERLHRRYQREYNKYRLPPE